MDTDAVPRRFTVDGGTGLAALDWTRAGADLAPLLLVHGLASNCRLWDGAARLLAGRGHPVVALDLRGHGLSDAPDEGYGIARVADDVAEVLDRLASDDPRWSRPVVMGQSWGGNIVVEVAARHGGRIAGVVAVDGGTIDLPAAFPSWEECERTLRPPALAGTPAARLRAWMEAAHPDWSREAIDGQMHNMEVLDDGTVRPRLTLDRHLQCLRGMWEAPPSRSWPVIDVPVMFVLAAREDDAHTRAKRAQVERAARELARCRTEWFVPADHDLHAQHPDRFADCVTAAFAEGFFR